MHPSHALLFSLVAAAGLGGCPAIAEVPSHVRVAYKEAPPFAIRSESGSWSGISIELWESIAAELGLTYEVREYELPELLPALEQGEVDVGVGALTMTAARHRRFYFTYGFFTSGLSIAVAGDRELGALPMLTSLVSLDFLAALAALVLALFVAGFLVWLFEHRRNSEQFGGGLVSGLGRAFWWSAVTMTTVGYGDKAPKTVGGRLIALIWMFIAIITISGFTASIASTLTLQRLSVGIDGPDDLVAHRVGTLAASTSERYLVKQGIQPVRYDDIDDALAALVRGDLSAVVHDRPVLRYSVASDFAGVVEVLSPVFSPQRYALAVARHQVELREELNLAILERVESGEWQDLLRRYLGE